MDILDTDYRLDPISLSSYKDDDLMKIFLDIIDEYDSKDETNSIELANKIVLLSDAQLVVIELVSRAEQIHEDYKLDAECEHAKEMKRCREEWEKEHPDSSKYPASSYFYKLALNKTKDYWKKVNKASATLKRYRKFMNSYETKINASKKLLAALENINY